MSWLLYSQCNVDKRSHSCFLQCPGSEHLSSCKRWSLFSHPLLTPPVADNTQLNTVKWLTAFLLNHEYLISAHLSVLKLQNNTDTIPLKTTRQNNEEINVYLAICLFCCIIWWFFHLNLRFWKYRFVTVAHLRCGYQNSSIYSVFSEVFQDSQMLIRCPWRGVHQQDIQLPPCDIWHKLGNHCCETKKKFKNTQKNWSWGYTFVQRHTNLEIPRWINIKVYFWCCQYFFKNTNCIKLAKVDISYQKLT